MANVLILDDNDVAGRALHGILARGSHTCEVWKDPAQAWRRLRATVGFDLVIAEVRLGQGNGLAFVQRLRADWFFRTLPVVIYTSENDPRQIRRALALNVQNYLLKPYDERAVQTEIARAAGRCWRAAHFEEARGWSERTGTPVAELAGRRRAVLQAFTAAAKTFPRWAEERQPREALAEIDALAEAAEAAGLLAAVDGLRHLRAQAEAEKWTVFETCGEPLDYASRLIGWQLDPGTDETVVTTMEPALGVRDRTERERWERIDAATATPLLKPEALLREIDGLAGCPVTSGTAAAFQMMAGSRLVTMSRMMDLVAGDPGLAAQVLGAVNRDRHDDIDEIEDPRVAASLLGETRLAALARALPVADERHFDLPPLNWPAFWLFQAAVGRVAQFVCAYLEVNYLTGPAGTAGLLHDLGKLLLLKLHPFALRAVVRRTRETGRLMADVERELLGCTTRDLAIRFAESQHLPSACRSVIRWVDSPALARSHLDLVAIVAVARHLVWHAHVGCWAEAPAGASGPVVATPMWRILQPRLFPSFDPRKFEVQAHAFCLTVRNELAGRIIEGRPSHAERAAELV
jgi:CheY-like chemotaxis protein/HD-like signal output (HDOD) protein